MKLFLKRALALLFATSMAFAACGGGGGGSDGNSSNGGSVIYVAGNYVDESKEGDSQYVSCVWKITDSGKTETALTNDSYPESVFVYNDTVYVSGTTWNSSSESYVACCWKISSDGTVTKYDLDGGLDAPSVFVHNGTAYIAGSCGTTSIIKACYWTISDSGTVTRTDLAVNFSSNSVYAKSIFVNDDAVYIAGDFYYSTLGKNVACCWEITAGAVTTGSITPQYYLSGQEANGILVQKGTIYISGGLYDGGTVTFTGAYWVITGEGSTRYDHAAVTNSYANTISVDSDGTVYTAGRRNGFYPCYWTGTTITELGPEEGRVSSISASGGTLYMAGNYSGSYGGGSVDVACYWKGTTRIDLTDLTDENISSASAAALFVYK
jgi:hypothetical protein